MRRCGQEILEGGGAMKGALLVLLLLHTALLFHAAAFGDLPLLVLTSTEQKEAIDTTR
ncbi:MAG: hypothetical protein NZ749_11300 [bacterium]|nr:hypothetical protein [bacterium]